MLALPAGISMLRLSCPDILAPSVSQMESLQCQHVLGHEVTLVQGKAEHQGGGVRAAGCGG